MTSKIDMAVMTIRRSHHGGRQSQRSGRSSLFLAAGAWAAAMLPIGAHAQDEPLPTTGGDDAEASFVAAQRAAEKGDIVTAIAALERVLQTDPDLANIKLELGLLYLRAGNPDLARSYLQVASNAPDAPAEARARAQQAFRTASGALGRFTFSGTLYASTTAQTNPNGSPSAVSVVGAGGVPQLITGDDLSIPRGGDFSATVGMSSELRYGLGGQRGNDLVANVSVAQTNYAKTSELDASYASAQIGPRIFIGPSLDPSGFVKPYATGTLLTLGHARYFEAAGAGVTLFTRPSYALGLTGQLNWEKRDYKGSRRRPAASEQSGDYWSGIAEASVTLDPRSKASFAGLFEQVDSRRSYWTRSTFGGQLGLVRAFAPPSGNTSWLARGTVTYRRSDYKSPDPIVDPVRKRKEDRFELEAGLSIPVKRTLTVDLRASQTWNKANLPNYDYDNTAISAGISFRF